ncbi:hypothetical protein [Flavobacterium sp. HSC-61S13]|uniref:hypothetical protein n=1 Tax=Flavobacterium sp. HSC-61S13 TaxID=2910963 RepID=UPI00209EE652|nr:hypothetical protein [Flavobacterium sp. HSC-61S13]MCP1995870.1 hypothetical protein [Flavobacterium sp. HSC-61S13]
MRRIFIILLVFASITVSCEKEDSIMDYGSDKVSYNKVEPGTYHYPNQKNRLFADGCNSKSNATCVLVVTAYNQPVIDFEEVDVEESFKDSYLDFNMPVLKKNLTKESFSIFKKTMVFNSQYALISWDMDLLETGAKEYFENYITIITEKMGADINRIVIVYESGMERIINIV